MKDNTRYVKKTFRLTEKEDEFLKRKMLERQEKKYSDPREGFSGFVRETLMEQNGAHTTMLRRQLMDLRHEIRKIGVNINQVTKKINGGLGNTNDIRVLQNYLSDIEDLLKDYEDKVCELWRLQN